jgi:hypothetical protein
MIQANNLLLYELGQVSSRISAAIRVDIEKSKKLASEIVTEIPILHNKLPVLPLQTDPLVQIENIISSLRILQPVCDEKGPIFNKVHIIAKCPHKHIHKYYIVDITAELCPTCTIKPRFLKLVHKTAEKLFNVPFTVEVSSNGTIMPCIYNRLYDIAILTDSTYIPQYNHLVVVKIQSTTSVSKITRDILEQIYNARDHITPTLSEYVNSHSLYLQIVHDTSDIVVSSNEICIEDCGYL